MYTYYMRYATCKHHGWDDYLPYELYIIIRQNHLKLENKYRSLPKWRQKKLVFSFIHHIYIYKSPRNTNKIYLLKAKGSEADNRLINDGRRGQLPSNHMDGAKIKKRTASLQSNTTAAAAADVVVFYTYFFFFFFEFFYGQHANNTFYYVVADMLGTRLM